MGAYAYCSKCSHAFGEPNAHEVMARHYICPACGAETPVSDDLADLLAKMESRIEQLEAQVLKLAQAVAATRVGPGTAPALTVEAG